MRESERVAYLARQTDTLGEFCRAMGVDRPTAKRLLEEHLGEAPDSWDRKR